MVRRYNGARVNLLEKMLCMRNEDFDDTIISHDMGELCAELVHCPGEWRYAVQLEYHIIPAGRDEALLGRLFLGIDEVDLEGQDITAHLLLGFSPC